jgi:hypothetical protein
MAASATKRFSTNGARQDERRPGPVNACRAVFGLDGLGAPTSYQGKAFAKCRVDGVFRPSPMNRAVRGARTVPERHYHQAAACRKGSEAGHRGPVLVIVEMLPDAGQDHAIEATICGTAPMSTIRERK